jgi:signal transduction histidine kinase
MLMISIFSSNDLDIIYFIYGLAFFTMGIAIGVKKRQYSTFTLAQHLWALAAFGLTHGLAEWATVFTPRHYVDNLVIDNLKVLEIVMIALSFTFLFHFGISLLLDSLGKNRRFTVIPWVMFLTWLGFFCLGGVFFHIIQTQPWLSLSVTWARYLLALPGSILTAWAFWMQMKDLEPLGSDLTFGLKATSFVFLAYGFFAGVMVNYAPFFPARVVNKQNFALLTGIPVELLRSICALVIAWFCISILKIFQTEQEAIAREVEHTRTVFNEREKFRQDIHDGIIQSIYAVGLRLECANRALEDASPAKEHIVSSIDSLNGVIRDVRQFLGSLSPEIFGWEELKDKLREISIEMRELQNVNVQILYQGEDNFLTEYQIELVYRICKEALHNISKHAKASSVVVKLLFKPESFFLEVWDNGLGFNVGGFKTDQNANLHNGLKFMQSRTKSLGGHLLIDSKLGKGTIIKMWIPRKFS